MNDSLWELVLIDSKGQIQGRALRLASKEYADALVEDWNSDRDCTKFRWKVSQIEGMAI